MMNMEKAKKIKNKKDIVFNNQKMILLTEYRQTNGNANFSGNPKFLGDSNINKVSQGRQTRNIRISIESIGGRILIKEGNREYTLDGVWEELNQKREQEGNKPYEKVEDCPKEEMLDALKEYLDIKLFGLTPSAKKYTKFAIQGAMAIENAYSLNEVFTDSKNETITSVMKEFDKEGNVKEGSGIGKKVEVIYSLTTSDSEIQHQKAKINKLTYEDVRELDYHMITAVQKGSSYTKVGAITPLYFRIDQNTGDFVIEPLGDYFEFIYLTDKRKVVSFKDYKIDATRVINKLKKYKDHIDTIYFYELSKVKFIYKEEVANGNDKKTATIINEHEGDFIELLTKFTDIKVCEISPIRKNNKYYEDAKLEK